MLAERVVVGLVARQCEQRPLQAAVIGHGEQQPAAAAQDAADLREEPGRVRDVLEHLRAPHEVDLAVTERERAVV
jgi:hypothetical protein